jgi:hypothetical protein
MKSALLFILVLIGSTLYAQVKGNVDYGNANGVLHNEAHPNLSENDVTLTVSGLLNTKATVFVATFHMMQVGETASSTDSLMTLRINTFRKSLEQIQRDSISWSIDMLSFVPKYDLHLVRKLFSKSYNEIPGGFELKKNMIVRYYDATDLDAIITAAASAEIYDLVKVDYYTLDMKTQYDKLRDQSLEILKIRIKAYETLGIKLDTLRKTFAEDFGTLLPHQRYSSYNAVARPSLEAARKISTFPGKISSSELSASTYYDPVSYGEYDFVINPVVDEPMVQLTYSITIKFAIPPKQSPDVNNVILLTPGGQVQKLNIREMLNN